MNDTSVNTLVVIAQIIVPIIAFLGITASMWLSVKTLREVQKDRKLGQLPHLAFDFGLRILPINFVKAGTSVTGISPFYADKLFKGQPDDAESVRLTETQYGNLNNYGLGTAFEVEVTWVAKKVAIGSEEFDIDSKKLLEPQYSSELNSIPSSPRHILPGEFSKFIRLPTFIQKDIEKKISVVIGIVVIKCRDIFNEQHVTNQEFRIQTNYGSESPNIYLTFGDLVKNDEAL